MDFTATSTLSEHRRQSFLAEADAHRRVRPSRPSATVDAVPAGRRPILRWLRIRRVRPAYGCSGSPS